MRLLATVTGSPSHARAVLPFARAVAALGLGRHVDGPSLAAGLAGVLDDARVRDRVRAAPRAMLALPPVTAFVERAESLVRA